MKGSNLKAIIVDDEKNAQEVLSILLERNCPEVNVVDLCSNVLDAVKSIKEHKPDVVFLDIQMPEYAGFEIVNFIDPMDFEIIFVTAFNEFAIKAFDLSAIDYLMKPLNRERLKGAVERAKVKKDQKENLMAYKALVSNLKGDSDPQILISEISGKRIIKLKEIVTIEGQRAYSEITLDSGKRILVSKNLKKMGELVSGFTDLYRCHKSWIVNIKKIDRINSHTQEISLITESIQKVKLSSNKIKELNDMLQR